MTRREKIIVGLMLAAAAGATVDFAISSRSAAKNRGGQDSAETEIAAAISRARVELATFQLNPVRERIRENLAADWRPDLLTAPAAPSPEISPEPFTKPTIPAFTAYFEIGGKPLAIIDGRDYAEGEWIANGNYQLIKISPSQAEIQPRAGDEPIVIPIETGFMK